ncbi:helix-turn-helix transcriptional regulator [Solwaraspora sp. WMMD1047]|uniref:helix-turn-helix domain-containing protein n=1 Tax=Solwaraspora sp. WMMD1047 TaxID=3016102 RepID=UPI002415FF1A|nr:helix-turn-helix transcriptional regulator [Solwaraspora sp. WMMD1047]MDG4832383.1 helix-turn-helix transcriptional regulator [Solwaraspora sp. WMMD1047]
MPQATRRAGARHPLDHDPVALRNRRVDAGRTQFDVATAAGISPGHLSELESGTRNPSPPVLAALAKVLGCAITDLRPQARL